MMSFDNFTLTDYGDAEFDAALDDLMENLEQSSSGHPMHTTPAYETGSTHMVVMEETVELPRPQPSLITTEMKELNPYKQVDKEPFMSWNPAFGKPKNFIDLECLTRVENVMQYFCFQGRDVIEHLDMEWLKRFIAERYPYDLISGSIFLDHSHAFEYKMKSFGGQFSPLETLPAELRQTFARTLFISWGILTHLFEGKPISGLFSNVRNTTLENGNGRGSTQYIFRIQRRMDGNQSTAGSLTPLSARFSDDNGGGDGSGDGDSDDHNYGPGHPGHRQQQRGAHGGGDRRPSKRSRENDGAEGSSGEGDSDEDEVEQGEQVSGDLSLFAHDVDLSDMSLLSEIAADTSASPESLNSSAVIEPETKDIADATPDVESSEGVQITQITGQAKSSSSEAAEAAMPDVSSSLSATDSTPAGAKTMDDRKAAASAPPGTTMPTSAANWSDTMSVAGTEVNMGAAADTHTLIDEAETVQWNDARSQRDGDSDVDDDDDEDADSVIGKKGAPLKKAGMKYIAKERTMHVANVGLGALTARTLTDVVAAMENPLMWDCPYVQLKDVLKKMLTRLTKDKEVGCDVDVVRVLLDMVESNRPPLDLSSKSAKVLGGLKPVTGATLLDADSNGEIGMDVHGKVVDRDAVYVPRGRNPLYLPLVMAVYGDAEPSQIKKLENMMSGSKMDHVAVRGK